MYVALSKKQDVQNRFGRHWVWADSSFLFPSFPHSLSQRLCALAREYFYRDLMFEKRDTSESSWSRTRFFSFRALTLLSTNSSHLLVIDVPSPSWWMFFPVKTPTKLVISFLLPFMSSTIRLLSVLIFLVSSTSVDLLFFYIYQNCCTHRKLLPNNSQVYFFQSEKPTHSVP